MADQPTGPAAPITDYPPSLVRAAEHLAAKFHELPWFVSAAPGLHDGRICLELCINEANLPRGMVLPTSFEAFKVVVSV